MAYIDKISVNGSERDLRDAGAARFDETQALTDAQKQAARANVGAASAADVTALTATVATKADAADVTTLAGRVTTAEGDIDGLEAAVDTKADAADVTALTAVVAGKVDTQQGVSHAGKALVVGADGAVTLGDAGVPAAVAETLLACFRKVAWVDATGQALYDALAQALGGDQTLLYQLAQATVFTSQSTPIDTGVKMVWGKKYTLLIEYSPDAIPSPTMVATGAVIDSTHYYHIQIGQHWRTHNPVVWGTGQSPEGDPGTQNTGIGTLCRHAIVFDQTGEISAKTNYTPHLYRNISLGLSEEYYTDVAITSTDLANIANYLIGGTTDSRFAGFQGLISDWRFYERALSSDEMQDFLLHGAHKPATNLVYALPEPTTFDGTGNIDTGFAVTANGVWTILLEYETTTFETDSNTGYVLSNIKTGVNTYLAMQTKKTGNYYISWGSGLPYSNASSNTGANDVMRHVLVIDTRSGAASSDSKLLVKQWYKNRTKALSGTYSTEYNKADMPDTTFLLGGTRQITQGNTNLKNFKGRVTCCRILSRELSEDERNTFLNYGRW